MPKRLSTVQFSVLLGVILALFASGIVAGAAGSAIILGTANDAGVTNTTIKTNSSGMAMQMNNLGTGVGGFFLSTSGVGLAAQTSLGSKYAGSFTNQGGSDGGGAAILATGKSNYGIVATSDSKSPIKVVSPDHVAPFEVNESTTVTNLSADYVDGLDGTALLTGTAFIPSGTTVVGSYVWDWSTVADNQDVTIEIKLPGRASVDLANETINFGSSTVATDDDAACTGSAGAPSAPAGKVCIYINDSSLIDGAHGLVSAGWTADEYFRVRFFQNSVSTGSDMYIYFTWAYTAV